MKKKNVLSLLSLLAMSASLVACGNKETTSAKPSDKTPTTEKTTVPVTTETPNTEAPDTSKQDDFDNLAPDLTNDPVPTPSADPAKQEEALPETAETRAFMEANDNMVNDFSSKVADDAITGEATKIDSPFLRVRANTANAESVPNTPDNPLYKLGTGSYEIEKGYSIGFKMKLADSKTVDNNHLVLALRGSDTAATFPIAFSNAKDPDGEALPSLSNEYKEFVISPNATIENENTPYKTIDGTGYSDLKVLSKILGFHLYVAGNCDATIDIQEVFLRKEGAEDIVLDNFDRADVNVPDSNCWWRGSMGSIVGRSVTVKGTGSFTQAIPADAAASNLVLAIKGDTTSTSIAFKNGENVITKKWSELKNSKGEALAAALHETYTQQVINLEKSGVTNNPTSITVTSASEVTINKIFTTDLVTRAADEYPVIDDKSAKLFDDFNRVQSGFNGDYDAATKDEKTKAAGLNYMLSYNNGDKVTLDGSAAVFDATSLAAKDFIQLKLCSDLHARTNENYLVFSMKLTNGATLDDFRFQGDTGPAVYANKWQAGFKVSSLATPYTKDGGYSLYVIDLAETGMSITNTIDMYYSGTGKLMIDQIFFANDYAELEKTADKEFTFKNNNLKDYKGAGFNTAAPIVALHVKGDGEKATLASVRIAYAGTIVWFNQNKIFDQFGHTIDITHVISAEGETVFIDISNVEGWEYTGEEKEFYIHTGDATCEGTLEFTSVTEYTRKKTNYEIGDMKDKVTSENGVYTFIGWMGAKRSGDDHVLFSMTVKGDGVATLDHFRIAFGTKEYWVDPTDEPSREQLYLENHQIRQKGIAVKEEGETLVFDLTDSGITIDGAVYMHYDDAHGGKLTFTTGSLISSLPSYEAVYNYFVK